MSIIIDLATLFLPDNEVLSAGRRSVTDSVSDKERLKAKFGAKKKKKKKAEDA